MSHVSEEVRQIAREAQEDCRRRLQEAAERENSERRAEQAATTTGSLLDRRGLML
jgi:hypothetical protein